MSRDLPVTIVAIVFALAILAGETTVAGIPANEESHDVNDSVDRSNRWSILRTDSFRICTLASGLELDTLPAACECLKERMESIWFDGKSRTWVPPCDVIVHATLQDYQESLGGNVGNSVGCATMQYDNGRVISRRIDIRVDADNWQVDALPHELTHVVLADRFGNRPLPPWLDEGIGVLSESASKRQVRVAAFEAALRRNMIYSTQGLVNLRRFPRPGYRDAFYVQSAALVRLLIDRSGPDEFARFAELTLTSNEDRALREVYQLTGTGGLAQLVPHADIARLVSQGGTLDKPTTLVAESKD